MTFPSDTAIVALSRRASVMGQRLLESLNGDITLYVDRRFAENASDEAMLFDLPLSPIIANLFKEYSKLVLFLPLGAVVRLLAPNLKGKHIDPAIVCVDDAGRYAVSLLSGHEGGADDFAIEVASALGATPIITSASHVLDTLAVDLLGREFGWKIDANPTEITRASASVVNGNPVGVYQEAGEKNWWPFGEKPLPENVFPYESLDDLKQSNVSTALVITDRILDRASLGDKRVITYYPLSLVVGMGCRKGVPLEELEQLLYQTFTLNGLALSSIKCIATSDVKKYEEGINLLARKLNVPVYLYNADELNAHPGPSGPSAANEHLGVIGVSEPAALIASGNDNLVVPKEKSASATIAVARKIF